MQEMLSSHGVTDVELVLYGATARGAMCYVKQGKTFNKNTLSLVLLRTRQSHGSMIQPEDIVSLQLKK